MTTILSVMISKKKNSFTILSAKIMMYSWKSVCCYILTYDMLIALQVVCRHLDWSYKIL